MHITLLTIGTRGDVQPFLVLGQALQGAGYQVCLASHAIFRDWITRTGLAFAPISGDPKGIQSQVGQDTAKTMQAASQLLTKILRDCWQACQGTDAIIYSPNARAGWHISEALQIPCLVATPYPYGYTGDFASIWLPQTWPWGRWGNWGSHWLIDQLLWGLVRRTINTWRQETLQLPPLGWQAPYQALWQRQIPILQAISAAVVPKPKDWPAWSHLTGYWLPGVAHWQPPPALEQFLAAGEPPLFIGFGSMVDADPASLAHWAIAALQHHRQRGILFRGWSGLSQENLPDSIFLLEEAPFDWLFPRMAAVIHHGGAGTVATSARAGVPTGIIPFGADQRFWADRLYRLGVGPCPIPRQRLTAEGFRDLVKSLICQPSYRQQAQALQTQVMAEDGVQQAVSLTQQYLGP